MRQRYGTRRKSSGSLLGGLLAVLLVLVLGAGPKAQAQPEEEAFAVDAVSVRSEAPGRTRLDLYTRVPYARLRFLNTAQGFAARYEVTAALYRLDDDGDRQRLAEQRTWEQAVQAGTFAATRSGQRFDHAAQSFVLRPGPYEVVVQLRDPASAQRLERTLSVEVRDLDGPVAVSSLILLDDFEAASNTISPRVSSRFGTDVRALDVFYELYAEIPRRVRITRQVLRTRQPGGLPVLGALLRLGREERPSEAGEVTYTQVEATRLQSGRSQRVASVPLSDARAGEYILRVRVEDERGRLLDQVERRITLEWNGLVAHLRDFDDAVAQLTYIAKDKDIEYIRDGATEAEQMERFRAFWDKRDPTPGTERNERMEEYYYRVARANRSYSQEARDLVAGWQTDRGHVLVLFGEPDAIERHNAQARPYEVWHYERIDRQFIFVDQEGRGAYKLLEPIWDERTRIR